MTNLNQNIQYLRHKLGLTQMQLADRAGVSKHFIHRVETFEFSEYRVAHYKLAEYLGYTLETLTNKSVIPDRTDEVITRCDEIEISLIMSGHCVKTSKRFINI